MLEGSCFDAETGQCLNHIHWLFQTFQLYVASLKITVSQMVQDRHEESILFLAVDFLKAYAVEFCLLPETGLKCVIAAKFTLKIIPFKIRMRLQQEKHSALIVIPA